MPNTEQSQETELETEGQLEEQVGDEVPEEPEVQKETKEGDEGEPEAAPTETAEPASTANAQQLQNIQQQLGFLMQTVQNLQNRPQPQAPAYQAQPNLEDMDRKQLVDYITNMQMQMTGRQFAQFQQQNARLFANIGSLIDTIAADNPRYNDAKQALLLVTQNPGLSFEMALNQTRLERLQKENRELKKQQQKNQKHIDKRKDLASNRQPPTPHAPVLRKNPPGEMTQEQRFELFKENARKMGIKLDV